MTCKYHERYREIIKESNEGTNDEVMELLPGDIFYCLEERLRW